MDKKVNDFVSKYYVERKNTHSVKWDGLKEKFGEENLLPLWVADMDFKTDEAILHAMKEHIETGVFGYSLVPENYYQTLNGWLAKRYHYKIEKEWLRFANGLVAAINWLVQCLTKEQEAVMILTPVYYPFHDAVINNQRKLVSVDLVAKNDSFVMDFKKIERAIVDNQVKLLIHCSPHNPIGRVWREEELAQLFELCEKYDVLIISDEIHQDLTFLAHPFTAAGAVSTGSYLDRLIILNAASKTFNLAALMHAHVIIPNEEIRQTYDSFVEKIQQTSANVLSLAATQAAYQKGNDWLEELLAVVWANYVYVKDTLKQALPKINVLDLQGTYLAFIDLAPYVKEENMDNVVQEKGRLAVDYGSWFGDNFGTYIRLNLATHPDLIKQAVTNLVEAIKETS